jgi:uncharacterized protein (DUF58 family)
MKVKQAISGTLGAWLNRRLPAKRKHTLTQRSIFIFPSRFGLTYLFVCLFLYILGTNYQNNLILLMSFTLIGFFITSILFSYANLSGLTIKSNQPEPVYADDTAHIQLYLSDSLGRNTLNFFFAKQPEVILELAQDNDKINVPFQPKKRGFNNPGRVTLRSYFPLGLLRCWTHLDMDLKLLVYPKPKQIHMPLLRIEEDDNITTAQSHNEMDDFVGIKDHIQGESLSRISWKHVAKNQQKLVSKQFSDSEFEPMWLSINQLSDADNEIKLSKLTFAVNYYSQQNVLFGLALNSTTVKPGMGEQHRLDCLKALALW